MTSNATTQLIHALNLSQIICNSILHILPNNKTNNKNDNDSVNDNK